MPNRIDELEAQAAVHRAGLAAALAGLTQNAQPAALMGTDIAQTVAQTALKTAKRNPLGAALMGVGLAMLIAKSGQAKPPTAAEAGTKAPTPDTSPSAEAMRLTLHEGLGHLPPEARKRVIRKRIEAMEAQEEVEKRPTDPLGVIKEHKMVAFLAIAGIGLAAAKLWPSKGLKAQEKRDQHMRAAEAQLQVEEARTQPFPGTNPAAKPAAQHDLHDRI
ncbi:hypothetical protein J4E08_05400 [Sagittula sp. NFXS13]|uniref:hypothetical protein n=1 Tax=Sagittula sp. NFXS13 TaxID=2819095 RepID=UPI0032DFC429